MCNCSLENVNLSTFLVYLFRNTLYLNLGIISVSWVGWNAVSAAIWGTKTNTMIETAFEALSQTHSSESLRKAHILIIF